MASREDLERFFALDIDHEALGLQPPDEHDLPYFCTPLGAEWAGRLGVDGIHFVLLPGDERVFCVDPSMGEEGTYVLPVAADFREFLTFVLFCRDANPLSQLSWLDEARFRQLLEEDAESRWEGCEEFFAKKAAALDVVAQAFSIEPRDPYEKVKALQLAFDPAVLAFSDEYYDALDLENPRHRGEEQAAFPPSDLRPVMRMEGKEDDP